MSKVYLPVEPVVDLTEFLAILPNVTDEANKGGYVPFENLIPPSSIQLTEAEDVAEGWPDLNAPEE